MDCLARLIGLLVAGLTLAGCFQPLYGSASGPAGTPALRQTLSTIEVVPIKLDANSPFVRMAVQLQNDLKFNFTGGGGAPPANYQLIVQITGSQSVVNASSVAGYPIITNYAFNATYSLVEVASKKQILTGRTVSTVSFDPSGAQRFARYSGAEDAKLRAAKEIADNITTRMASFFVSGT
jgi:LPS-assembly lipoprotein